MRITIKLWASFTPYLPDGAEGYAAAIEVPDGSTARQIAELNGVPFADCRLMLLNGVTHTSPPVWGDIKLEDGDTLALLPKVH